MVFVITGTDEFKLPTENIQWQSRWQTVPCCIDTQKTKLGCLLSALVL